MTAGLNSLLGEVSSYFLSFMMREIIFSAVLFILIFMLTIFLRNKSPLWHIGLWTFVLIRLVLPPGFTNPVAKYEVLHNIQFINEVNDMFSELKTQEYQNYTSSIQSASSTQNALVFERETSKIDNTSNNYHISSWKTAVFGIWLLGFLITLSIYIKRYIYFRRLIRNSSHLQNDCCHVILAHWQKVFKVKRCVKLVYSQQGLSPFTMGVLKPVIYLPQSLLEKDDSELLNSVISHEVAHIKHFDALWIKFQNLIQSLYFFYPVVWYANSRIHLARECLRDTQVISRGDISPKIFGKGILSLLRMNLVGSADFLYLPRFGNEKKKVTYRLRNLKSKRGLMYQRILTYLFLFGLGAYVIPIFGSIQSNGALADNYESGGVRLGSMPTLDDLSKERSEAAKDENILASSSIKSANSYLDSTEKQQKSPERVERGSEKHIKPIQTRTTSTEEQLPAFVEIPDEIVEERLGVTDLGKMGVEENESGVKGEENEGAEKGNRSLFKSVVRGALIRLIESDSNMPVRLEGQFIPPKPINRVKPRYPLKARQARVEGVVILEAATDEFGRVKHVKVLRSIRSLDQAAVEAVKQWIYEPMIINGRPRSVIFKVTVNFILERSP